MSKDDEHSSTRNPATKPPPVTTQNPAGPTTGIISILNIEPHS